MPRALRCALLALCLAPAAAAQQQVLTLDPAATRVTFALGATLHSVEGTLRLVSGELRFDALTGAAAGEIRLDARSAATGLEARDRELHAEVLESERHPEIVFRAASLGVVRRDAAGAVVELAGTLELHGEKRPWKLPATLRFDADRVAIESGFRLPYVDWGVRDPSVLLLRVDRFVDVRVASEGRLAAP